MVNVVFLLIAAVTTVATAARDSNVNNSRDRWGTHDAPLCAPDIALQKSYEQSELIIAALVVSLFVAVATIIWLLCIILRMKCCATNNRIDESSDDQSMVPVVTYDNGENDRSHKRNAKIPMDTNDFRRRGRDMIEYAANYMDNLHKKRVSPTIKTGYLKECLPMYAPEQPEDFDDVMKDLDRYIMPGVLHWNHRRFFAFFPAGNSYPSLLADIFGDIIGSIGFSWESNPVTTELEYVMMQWFGHMLKLPSTFLPFTAGGTGGGSIQGSASDCVYLSVMAARYDALKSLKLKYPHVEEYVLLSKLRSYCSVNAHSSIPKAAKLAMVTMRLLPNDEKFSLRGETLRKAVKEDRAAGYFPFFVGATAGTTAYCSFDNLKELGPVCREENLWMHVDGAYAGSAMINKEYRHLLDGVEDAMTFMTNPNKWMLISFDCSCMWVRDKQRVLEGFLIERDYYINSKDMIDLRNWGVPLSRRFRSLKLWFTIRTYGVEGLRRYQLEHARLAKIFANLLLGDGRFKIINEVIMGLVCFRVTTFNNEDNERLLNALNESGLMFIVPAHTAHSEDGVVKPNSYVFRFCVTAERATESDMHRAYDDIVIMMGKVEQDPSLGKIVKKDGPPDSRTTSEGLRKRLTGSRNQAQLTSPACVSARHFGIANTEARVIEAWNDRH